VGKERDELKLDDHLCFALYGASMAVGRAYKPVLDGWGITYPQYLVLSTLWEEAPLSSKAVADRLALEPSTVTPLVGRLVENGFLTRERDEQDRRQVVIGLTEKGRALKDERACLAETLLSRSGMKMKKLAKLNEKVRALRDAIAEATPEGDRRA
jgi:MarR family transcriptional regulator, organic hydroperoxide resistance regulator